MTKKSHGHGHDPEPDPLDPVEPEQAEAPDQGKQHDTEKHRRESDEEPYADPHGEGFTDHEAKKRAGK